MTSFRECKASGFRLVVFDSFGAEMFSTNYHDELKPSEGRDSDEKKFAVHVVSIVKVLGRKVFMTSK